MAPTRSNVLVTGESGTGKELVARAIHARSDRAEKAFLAVNMAAVPRDMLEAQLFGHEKGAFSGAFQRREGLLRAAGGGTIFLDEIAETPLDLQAKLLRAVELREVLAVGADRPVTAEFRLVAATNQNLEEVVESGRFRRDLFYRLNVFQIRLPPLRERREDIPALVDHLAVLHAHALGRRPPVVTNDVMKRLLAYAWPGNVRELSNVVERACILAGTDPLAAQHLPLDLRSAEGDAVGLKAAVEGFERRHIRWVLQAVGGNRERAAKMLGVDPATLYRRLAKYALSTV